MLEQNGLKNWITRAVNLCCCRMPHYIRDYGTCFCSVERFKFVFLFWIYYFILGPTITIGLIPTALRACFSASVSRRVVVRVNFA